MQCAIYKSPRKQDTYLYLAARDDFSCLPENLLKLLGKPVHVMDLELHPDRQLAQEDIVEGIAKPPGTRLAFADAPARRVAGNPR